MRIAATLNALATPTVANLRQCVQMASQLCKHRPPNGEGMFPDFRTAHKSGYDILEDLVRRHACSDWDIHERILQMNLEHNKTSEKMNSVRAAWDKAPSGPKKETALKHYQAAEKALAAKNDAETNKELDAASQALS